METIMRKLVHAVAAGALVFVVIAGLTSHPSGRGRHQVYDEELALIGGIAAATLMFTRKK